MLKVNELKGFIRAKGYTQETFAEKLGITPKTLGIKIKKGVFGSDEIEAMIELLDIPDPLSIFFAR